MPHDLPKAYDPTAIEDHWAEYWVRENLFAQPTPEEPSSGEAGHADGQSPFTILLPPPNVTGNLHMGHMFEHTESDILIRWRRMCGVPVDRSSSAGRMGSGRVLWIPGTDHAGIATQMLVERQVVEEGTTRQQLGREAFVARVWEWRRHYGGNILSQMKRLGASVDWQREYFTMDDNLSVAVREAFVRLYAQGLIYRGAYIVNWCPRCQTAISDLEVVYDEHKGHLWEVRYPVLGPAGKDTGEFITVATTRPETMLGDTAVAIHPEDERYLHLHGKKLRLPLIGREIPIVLDEWVSRDFGTGAVKVTPAHDPNDFALGERHHLPSINVMDDTAHINAEGGAYAGLDRYVARKRILADLEAQGLLAGVKDHTNNIGHCDRCKTVVEPRLSTQWFIKIQPLADKAIAAVKPGPDGKKAIRFTPEQYEKTYLNWMENIHDWCISRQLWWGHRIPAWHCATCHKITVPAPNRARTRVRTPQPALIAVRPRSPRKPTSSTPGSPPAFSPSPSSAGPISLPKLRGIPPPVILSRVPHPFRVLQRNGWETKNPHRVPQVPRTWGPGMDCRVPQVPRIWGPGKARKTAATSTPFTRPVSSSPASTSSSSGSPA